MKKLILAACPIEPGHALIAANHGHLAIMEGSHIFVRLDRQDRIGFRPVARRRPPDSREIEPVAIREREAIVLAAAPMAELGGWHKEAVIGKGAPFCLDDGKCAASRLAWLKAPRQLDHLDLAAVTPDDDASLANRCLGS